MTLQEIENTYGAELAEELKERIDSANKLGIDHKIEIFNNEYNIHLIAFVTRSYTYFFRVFADTGMIIDESKIGYSDCKRALGLMDELGEVSWPKDLNISL